MKFFSVGHSDMLHRDHFFILIRAPFLNLGKFQGPTLCRKSNFVLEFLFFIFFMFIHVFDI